MIKLSVILPVYNCEQYINECIESVLNQTYTNFELLIIDDCSTDATVSLISSYNDERIKLILKEKNSGYTDSLNYAINISKGEYIARMDGDDICLPTRFQKQIRFLEENEDIILCGTAIQIIGTNKVLKNPLNHDEIKVKLCFGSSFFHPTVMGKSSTFKNNRYDKSYEPAEDYDLWCRLVFEGKLANIEEVLLEYRVHDNQVSNTKRIIQENAALNCRIKMFKKLIGETMFEDTFLSLLLKNGTPDSIEFCEKALMFYNTLINRNKELGVYDEKIFKETIRNKKSTLLREYFTKRMLFKRTTLIFFIKHLTFKDFISFLNLKKRIKYIFLNNCKNFSN